LFGKKLSEYIRFDLWILILIAVVFAARLVASQSGASFAAARWISINIVLLLGMIYCSIAVHTSGFGRYKQLFGLLLVQAVFAHVLIACAIAGAILTRTTNIYTVPEVSGGSDGTTWIHVFAHLFLGGPLVSLLNWGLGSLILLATRRLQQR
jgi:hypothetical protein